MTQILGCFRRYFYVFKHKEFPECPVYLEVNEDAEYVFFSYPSFSIYRCTWDTALEYKILPENLVKVEVGWEATSREGTQ